MTQLEDGTVIYKIRIYTRNINKIPFPQFSMLNFEMSLEEHEEIAKKKNNFSVTEEIF